MHLSVRFGLGLRPRRGCGLKVGLRLRHEVRALRVSLGFRMVEIQVSQVKVEVEVKVALRLSTRVRVTLGMKSRIKLRIKVRMGGG